MFRPRSMDQVEILLLRRDLAATLKALARARIIHLQQIGTESNTERHASRPEEDRLQRYRDFALKCLELAEGLNIGTETGSFVETGNFPAWEEWLEDLRQRVASLQRRQEETRYRRIRLIALARFLKKISGVCGSFEQLVRLHSSSLQLGLLPDGSFHGLSDLPDGCRVYLLGRMGGQRLIVVLGLRQQRGELLRLLDNLHFLPISLPSHVRGEIGDVETRIRRLRSRLRRRAERLARKMNRLGGRHERDLRDRLYSCRVELHLLEQERRFRYTRRTVTIGGWVLANRRKELERLLEKSCEGYQLLRASARGRKTPVQLFNPALLRPFQKVLSAYGTPSYGEVEPTPLLAFAFVLLFGMMFGDLGHGVVLLLAGLALRRWSRWREEGMIMAEVGCSAALFGLLFGSVFGWEGLFEPLWFSPMHHIPFLMATALLTGAALMTAGMLLGIFNGLREGPPGAVLTDRYGAAGILFYLGSLVMGYLVYRSRLPAEAMILLAVPLVAVFFHPFFARAEGERPPAYLLCAEGIVEVIETVLGFLANTFSFLRVAAFGLAHIGLSLAVFALAEQALTLPFGILFAALIHLFGNLVILVLEGLIVSIQTVRLEFYEFFGKFFRGGGTAFHPLTLDPIAERRT